MPRVMIVEDEFINAKVLRKRMMDLGYEVGETATTAEDAIEKAKLQNPDLILMDISLPGNLDGIDAAGVILAEKKIPIIFLSGFTYSEFETRLKPLTPSGYLTKPVHFSNLDELVKKALIKDL